VVTVEERYGFLHSFMASRESERTFSSDRHWKSLK